MALTKKDLYEFGQQFKTDIVREIRDEMDARFSAFRNETKSDRENLKKEIHNEFIEAVHGNIMPAIDQVHERIDRVHKRVDQVHEKVDSVRDELKKEIQETRHELKHEIHLVRHFVGMPTVS